jgi:hypothetical protein
LAISSAKGGGIEIFSDRYRFDAEVAVRRSLAALTVLFCSLIGGQGMTGYQGPDYLKLKALLPPAAGAVLCLARTYDEEHLKRLPKQRVTELILFIRYTILGDDEAVIETTEDGGTEKRYFDYDFTLAAKTKDHDQTLYASGDCASAEGIGCGVDCDGGGIEIEPLPGQDDTILVRLERIHMTLGCGEGADEVELEAGEDDKVFKLKKAPAATCNAMEAKLGNRF